MIGIAPASHWPKAPAEAPIRVNAEENPRTKKSEWRKTFLLLPFSSREIPLK
jgi:hypothetical protein